MKVLIVFPKRDPKSAVRTQYDWQRVFELVSWPLNIRGYGLYPNVLDTLASLTPGDVDVQTVNEYVEDIDFGAKVDLVAISCMVTTATRGYEVADAFRARGIPVIMGGYHPFSTSTVGLHGEVLDHTDSICTSEGDDVWTTILDDARQGGLRRTYSQTSYTDIASREYRQTKSRWEWLRYGHLTIQASRGCPFNCNFCSIVRMLGNAMRYKTPEAIVRELEPIYKKDLMGRTIGRPIFLVDDNIFGTPKEFKKMLRAIIELNHRYPKFKPFYGSQLTINISRDTEALELMQEAGFNTAFIGLESLDPDVLRSYNKLHNVAFDYDRAVQTLRSYGMETVTSFIFGQDADTEESFDAAFDFIQRNNIVYPFFDVLVPNAGQWKELESEARILTRQWSLYDGQHTVFIPAKMRPIELQSGFVNLVSRVFEYENVRKRLIGAFIDGSGKQMMLPYPLQMFFYLKTLAALALARDWKAYHFVKSLDSYLLSNRLSMFHVIFEIDQHDYAQKNRLTLEEHDFDLDIPPWSETSERERLRWREDAPQTEVAAN